MFSTIDMSVVVICLGCRVLLLIACTGGYARHELGLFVLTRLPADIGT